MSHSTRTQDSRLNHPGINGVGCDLQIIVQAPTRAAMSGYGCSWTGGHCVPGERCADFRRREAEIRLLEDQLK